MIVTIDCNTKPVELYHLSILFQSLAKAHGFVAPVEVHTSASQTSTIGEMSVTLNVDTTNATSAVEALADLIDRCLLYTSPSPRDRTRSRMPSSA